MLAKITKGDTTNKIPGRLRHKHLAPTADRRDPCRTMNIHPHIALIRHKRLPGMDANPHTNRPFPKKLHQRRSRRYRIPRSLKDDEE